MLGACIGQGHSGTVPRELARYKSDLVGAQEVRWDKGDKIKTGKLYSFSKKKKKKYHQLETGVCVHHRVASEVKRVEFVSD
jgi:hypothetical protein